MTTKSSMIYSHIHAHTAHCTCKYIHVDTRTYTYIHAHALAHTPSLARALSHERTNTHASNDLPQPCTARGLRSKSRDGIDIPRAWLRRISSSSSLSDRARVSRFEFSIESDDTARVDMHNLMAARSLSHGSMNHGSMNQHEDLTMLR